VLFISAKQGALLDFASTRYFDGFQRKRISFGNDSFGSMHGRNRAGGGGRTRRMWSDQIDKHTRLMRHYDDDNYYSLFLKYFCFKAFRFVHFQMLVLCTSCLHHLVLRNRGLLLFKLPLWNAITR
jgi:hypothetical protein